jgi:hypothetical protein
MSRRIRIMKKLLVILSLTLTLCAMSFAQTSHRSSGQDVKPMSFAYDWSDSAFGITYIHDRVDSFVGVSYKAHQLNPRTRLDVIGVTDLKSNASLYVGTLLKYRLVEDNALKLDVGVGFKGLDITGSPSNWNFNTNRQFVWSVGVTIPFRT